MSKFVFFVSLLFPVQLLAEPVAYTCSPDTFGKSAIDGAGYAYKSGEFVALPGTQAWSKMLLRFDRPDSPQNVFITIYGAFVKTADPEFSAKLLSSDEKAVTFYYENKKSDPKVGDLRETWVLTFFPKSSVLYFSLHSFDNQGSDVWNSPPLVRGQLFKSKCTKGIG